MMCWLIVADLSFYSAFSCDDDVGVAHAGNGGFDAPAAKKSSSTVVDFITPETETFYLVFLGYGA